MQTSQLQMELSGCLCSGCPPSRAMGLERGLFTALLLALSSMSALLVSQYSPWWSWFLISALTFVSKFLELNGNFALSLLHGTKSLNKCLHFPALLFFPVESFVSTSQMSLLNSWAFPKERDLHLCFGLPFTKAEIVCLPVNFTWCFCLLQFECLPLCFTYTPKSVIMKTVCLNIFCTSQSLSVFLSKWN